MSEQSLKEQILANLADDFEIIEEIPGYHPIYEKRVRIDLLLKAKQHLVNEGFTDQWFGVECKWSEGVCGQTSKITRMIWQSITYAQSTFEVGEERIIPRFVAVFTPDNMPETIERLLSQLLGLGLYGCVGRLYFYQDHSCGIKFASIYGRNSPNGYTVNQKQLPKLRAGSV